MSFGEVGNNDGARFGGGGQRRCCGIRVSAEAAEEVAGVGVVCIGAGALTTALHEVVLLPLFCRVGFTAGAMDRREVGAAAWAGRQTGSG